jgi:hypothetical protein
VVKVKGWTPHTDEVEFGLAAVVPKIDKNGKLLLTFPSDLWYYTFMTR